MLVIITAIGVDVRRSHRHHGRKGNCGSSQASRALVVRRFTNHQYINIVSSLKFIVQTLLGDYAEAYLYVNISSK